MYVEKPFAERDPEIRKQSLCIVHLGRMANFSGIRNIHVIPSSDAGGIWSLALRTDGECESSYFSKCSPITSKKVEFHTFQPFSRQCKCLRRVRIFAYAECLVAEGKTVSLVFSGCVASDLPWICSASLQLRWPYCFSSR